MYWSIACPSIEKLSNLIGLELKLIGEAFFENFLGDIVQFLRNCGDMLRFVIVLSYWLIILLSLDDFSARLNRVIFGIALI
jgi:hypothetical protein